MNLRLQNKKKMFFQLKRAKLSETIIINYSMISLMKSISFHDVPNL